MMGIQVTDPVYILGDNMPVIHNTSKPRLKRILVGTSSRLPYTHFFGVSTGVCFQNWWVDAQIIGTPHEIKHHEKFVGKKLMSAHATNCLLKNHTPWGTFILNGGSCLLNVSCNVASI
jgi:hypothetical protein